jgi:hypothetical protein
MTDLSTTTPQLPARPVPSSRQPVAAARNRADWLVPAGLVLLSLVPVAAGSVRLAQLSTGAEVTPENARFFDSPVPVVLHIVAVTIYSLLGAFQFSPRLRRLRRRGRRWHPMAGRLVVPSGLVVALTGLWMTHFYEPPANDGEILYMMRFLVGSAMIAFLLLGVDAVRRRDYARHGAWMLRAYALAMGAGTQVFTHLPWIMIYGTPGELQRAVLMGAGWAINFVVAEWIIRRQHRRRASRARALAPASAAAALQLV